MSSPSQGKITHACARVCVSIQVSTSFLCTCIVTISTSISNFPQSTLRSVKAQEAVNEGERSGKVLHSKWQLLLRLLGWMMKTCLMMSSIRLAHRDVMETHTHSLEVHTSVLLGQVVCHLPVVIAVENAVGDADMIGCHLVDALWDADDGWRGQGIGIGEAPLRSHGAGRGGVGRHRGWGSSAPGRWECRKTQECGGWYRVR